MLVALPTGKPCITPIRGAGVGDSESFPNPPRPPIGYIWGCAGDARGASRMLAFVAATARMIA